MARLKGKGVQVSLTNNYAKIATKLTMAVQARLEEVGIYLQDAFADKLHGPRSGRMYFYLPRLAYGFSSPFYIASADHEFPAERTGSLLHSMEWGITLGTTSAASLALHFGTDISYGLEINYKRPFLRRGIIEELDVIQRMLSRPLNLNARKTNNKSNKKSVSV